MKLLQNSSTPGFLKHRVYNASRDSTSLRGAASIKQVPSTDDGCRKARHNYLPNATKLSACSAPEDGNRERPVTDTIFTQGQYM